MTHFTRKSPVVGCQTGARTVAASILAVGLLGARFSLHVSARLRTCLALIGLPLHHELVVDAPHDLNLVSWPLNQDDPIRPQALVLYAHQRRFRHAALVRQLATQAVSTYAALPIAQFYETTLTGKNLGGEFSAMLPRYRRFMLSMNVTLLRHALVFQILNQITGYVTRPIVEQQTRPMSDTIIYEIALRNEFPRRIILMPQVAGWKLGEVGT